ncbi:hypothetical protein MNV49_001081 [Pseudohyphozyma bogoriensis]|nr:hypothetical protein MNV49_001081 [Pseudohyphozyma bogoriensis]
MSCSPSSASASDERQRSASGTSRAPPKKRKKRLTADGQPLKRAGKVVKVLRNQYALLEGQVGFGFLSTTARIVSEELSGALVYHLIDCATGGFEYEPLCPAEKKTVCICQITTPSRTTFNNRHSQQLFITSTRASGMNSREDVVLASLIALGARRSYHSAIVGGRALEGGKSMKDMVGPDVGIQREMACRKLAQRAVDLAEACDLLRDTSPEGLEAATVLRMALFAVNPRHPFGSDLAAHLHQSFKRQKTLTHAGEPATIQQSDLAIIEYDSYIAVLTRKAPRISLTELSLLYGWSTEQIDVAVEKLKTGQPTPDGALQQPGRVISTAVLRGVSRIQREDVFNATQDFKRTLSLFIPVWSLSDLMIDLTLRLAHLESTLTPACPASHPSPAYPREKVSPRIGSVPMVVEASLLYEATRFCGAAEDPVARELLRTQRERFLKWLKIYVGMLEDPQFVDPEGNHSRALLLSVLDLAPDWIELVTEAAQQTSLGTGPFAGIGLSWEDLLGLQKHLASASAVFARSSRQKDRLSDAFERMSLGGASQPGSACSENQYLAQSLVEQTIYDLDLIV